MKSELMKTRDKNALPRTVDILSSGGIITYPTETCYGLGADATNDAAVKRIIHAKKRIKEKKISIAFSDIRMAKHYLVIIKNAEKLIKAFMPGPLMLIVESKSKPQRKVGFRIPDNKFILRLIRKFGKPITTTSANISGKAELYKIKDVIKTFNGKVDLILDGGNLPKTRPSTVYDVVDKKILRKGPISEKKIREVLNA